MGLDFFVTRYLNQKTFNMFTNNTNRSQLKKTIFFRSKSCKKDLWQQINQALQANSKWQRPDLVAQTSCTFRRLSLTDSDIADISVQPPALRPVLLTAYSDLENAGAAAAAVATIENNPHQVMSESAAQIISGPAIFHQQSIENNDQPPVPTLMVPVTFENCPPPPPPPSVRLFPPRFIPEMEVHAPPGGYILTPQGHPVPILLPPHVVPEAPVQMLETSPTTSGAEGGFRGGRRPDEGMEAVDSRFNSRFVRLEMGGARSNVVFRKNGGFQDSWFD